MSEINHCEILQVNFSIPLSRFLFLSVPISFPLSLSLSLYLYIYIYVYIYIYIYVHYIKNITQMIFINTMNSVTIAYHFLKTVQQKYNLREESLLTDTKNKNVNQLIRFFEEIVSSHNLVIGIEYTLDLRKYPPPT